MAGSVGVLDNVERYALYLARVMQRRGSGPSNMTGSNIGVYSTTVYSAVVAARRIPFLS